MERTTVIWILALAMLSGCATTGVRVEPRSDTLETVTAEVPEAQLLDVWIELFDPGQLPTDKDQAVGLSMDIREAEARFMPVHLRDTMERTGYWGAVRLVPRGTEGAEVLVLGTILASDGEVLELEITAEDATGRQWFNKKYASGASEAFYRRAVQENRPEAFQALYNAIANDLARFRSRLSSEEIRNIRRVAELRFAIDLAPDAFSGHLVQDGDGRYQVVRLPARNDPMVRRIRAIRERDFLLIDTLNGHFDNFYLEMETPYNEWRKARSEEAAALREIERQANNRKLMGFAAIAGAIAIEVLSDGNARQSTSSLRNVMVIGGAYAVKTGFDKASEAEINRAAIEELGDSFSSEARPLVVDVEGETHELTGSAEVQYAQWRGLLRDAYAAETGLIDTAN